MLPTAVGGPPYQHQQNEVDETLLSHLMSSIALDDHLLMRGLGAFLKASMLWQRTEFAEAATLMLFVALEASFQLVLRLLRSRGISNPSAEDAGNFIDATFNPPGMDAGSYFFESYVGRVKTMHPSSRYGVFPFAPLHADDYMHLRHDLLALFAFLITGHNNCPDLWA